LAADLRAAYVPGVTLTGAGQKLGLFELDGYYPNDITAYESLAGLAGITVSNVLLDGFDGSPGIKNDEVALDIDMAMAMAPGLSEIIVYEGLNPEDVLNRMATDNLAKQLSTSWIWEPFTPVTDQIFQQMAAQGQAMFEAANDWDAYDGTLIPPNQPSDDPYVISVGGTTLTMTANNSAYVSETVWNSSDIVGSSGGISTRYPIPPWQQGTDMSRNGGSTTMRNLPDVAMIADNLFIFYSDGQPGTVGGTSCATPLWAGFTALANEAAAASGEPVVGFINPALYAIGNSPSYNNNFHDITSGNNRSIASSVFFNAVPGYDLCTGWGTPKGSNLIYSLAVPEPLRIAPSSDLVLSGVAGGPFGPAGQMFTLTNKGSGTIDWAVSTASPWMDITPTNGTLNGGGPAPAVTVQASPAAASLAAGRYAATLTFSNLTDQVAQTRQVILAIVSPPIIVIQPSSEAVPEGATVTFSVETSTNALLEYQWVQETGTNAIQLTDGTNFSGTDTSTLTISNASPVTAGSYAVIVSNAAGSVTSSNAVLSLVFSRPVIVAQPVGLAALPGATAVFRVTATGGQPFFYSWQLNGTNLSDGGGVLGSSSNTLTIDPVTIGDQGSYAVVVSNALGQAASVPVSLTVGTVTTAGVTLDLLYSFSTNNAAGVHPYASLLQTSDGNFYGTASAGGAAGFGTVFRLATNNAVSLVHGFQYSSDGAFPYGALVQGANGLLYGATSWGGSSQAGTVFRMGTNGATLSAPFAAGSTGDFSYAGLVQGNNGEFYGAAEDGGLSGYYGAIFRVTSSLSLAGLHSFSYDDGAYPTCTPLQASDGNLYGTTKSGGTNGGWGTIFKMTPTGSLTLLCSFANTNGAVPLAGLVQDADGTFYGTTYAGGANSSFLAPVQRLIFTAGNADGYYGGGTVFKMSASGGVNTLYEFSSGQDGANPAGGLLVASDGNLYGTTEQGGAYSMGTVFRISPDGTLSLAKMMPVPAAALNVPLPPPPPLKATTPLSTSTPPLL
jgi:uncharacterized repeat protein (TIGR03803 family)